MDYKNAFIDINMLPLINILPGLKIAEEAKSSWALFLTIIYAGNNQFVFFLINLNTLRAIVFALQPLRFENSNSLQLSNNSLI